MRSNGGYYQINFETKLTTDGQNNILSENDKKQIKEICLKKPSKPVLIQFTTTNGDKNCFFCSYQLQVTSCAFRHFIESVSEFIMYFNIRYEEIECTYIEY